jgi:DHA2 family multidrug resistance protein
MDQRVMLAGGCMLQAVALWMMTHVTPTMDFWSLAWPRFVQGFSQGFIFVPLQALSLATVTTERLGNATAAYNVLRNIGGSVGVALATTMLARRSQFHQTSMTSHIHPWNPIVDDRLRDWTAHFIAQGADSFTAARRAMAMLYREAVMQARVLSYADDFWLLLSTYVVVFALIPFMRRVRAGQLARGRARPEPEAGARDPGLPAPTSD